MDVTERKQAQEALRDSELRFRSMADGAPLMICASGAQQQATFFNKRWLGFTGRAMEREVGYGWTENVHPEDLARVLTEMTTAAATRGYCHVEYRLRRVDGEYRWILCNGTPCFARDGAFAGYVASAIDITNLKHYQEEAAARLRLESVGMLASGIAHDFNNLLSSILADSELIEGALPVDSRIREGISRIKLVAVRGTEIASELLSYTGNQDAAVEPVDLSAVTAEMLQALKTSISKRATLRVDLPAHLPPVRANASQIRQVVLNLVTNACEALGDAAGVIEVSASSVHESRKPAPSEGGLPEGDYIRLDVCDTGCGMTRDVAARAFDPYFTTKLPGRGLGLDAVRGIVRRHGGEIQVASAPGQGTCIAVLLPCDGKPEVQSASESESDRRAGKAVSTILLVEDEAALRTPVSKMLRKKGYTVFEAADGDAGLEIFRAEAQKIDVVLLDMTLPGRSGAEMLPEFQGIQPRAKVILTTAYSEQQVLHILGGQKPWAFLRKPYHVYDLVKLLRRTDSGHSASEGHARMSLSAGQSA